MDTFNDNIDLKYLCSNWIAINLFLEEQLVPPIRLINYIASCPNLRQSQILNIYFSPDAIDFSVCNAVQSFKIDEFKDRKVFEEGLIVAFSAGELNAQGFGKERTNNWNGMN